MLNKRSVQLLVLAAAFITLLVLVQVTETPDETADLGTDTPAPNLLDLDATQVQLIRVERVSDGAVTLIERNAEGIWRIASTVHYQEAPDDAGVMQELPTDQDAALLLAQAVSGMELQEGFSAARSDGDMEGFCLAPAPDYRVRVALADDTQYVIEIGCTNPKNSAYYVSVRNTETVHLALRYTVERLTKIVDEPPYLTPGG